MDRRKTILNISVSVIFKIIILVVSIFNRIFLIKYIGNDVNGLNSLYASIIGFLSVAELGIGGAISFSMYKPIVEHNTAKVNALYVLYKKLYLLIGIIILLAGGAIMPFLPKLVADYELLNVDLYLSFFFLLLSVVLSYGFSAEVSLINAYKNNYITTSINSSCRIICLAIQMIAARVFRSFTIFLLCEIITVIIEWSIVQIYARKNHMDVMRGRNTVDAESKREIVKNIKAMFFHRIGGVLVNATDSTIISAFLGVVLLGKYSNYTIIMSAVVGIIRLFFTPLTSVIGHMFVESSVEKSKRIYRFFYCCNVMIGVIFFLGYYAVVDDFITICFGDELKLAKSISAVITINQFVQFLRQSTLLFRDATGTFYYDRWKPIMEGIANIILSVTFVLVFPEDYKIVGVIAATVITNLFICHVIEPYVIYKHVFKERPINHYLKNYLYIGLFAISVFLLDDIMISNQDPWIELLANGLISVAVSTVFCILVFVLEKDFRGQMVSYLRLLKKKIKHSV